MTWFSLRTCSVEAVPMVFKGTGFWRGAWTGHSQVFLFSKLSVQLDRGAVHQSFDKRQLSQQLTVEGGNGMSSFTPTDFITFYLGESSTPAHR